MAENKKLVQEASCFCGKREEKARARSRRKKIEIRPRNVVESTRGVLRREICPLCILSCRLCILGCLLSSGILGGAGIATFFSHLLLFDLRS
jgi:hypothetical protein